MKKELTFQALNEHVQIELIKESKRSTVAIAEVVKKKTARGKVLSVGAGRLLANGTMVKPQVEIGDDILFNPALMDEMSDNLTKIYVINAMAIYGKFK